MIADVLPKVVGTARDSPDGETALVDAQAMAKLQNVPTH
jgi:hypothetical protein